MCLMKASIWATDSLKQKPFSNTYLHQILDVLWDKCVDYSGNYRDPESTWWWKKREENRSFSASASSYETSHSLANVLHSAKKLHDLLQNYYIQVLFLTPHFSTTNVLQTNTTFIWGVQKFWENEKCIFVFLPSPCLFRALWKTILCM